MFLSRAEHDFMVYANQRLLVWLFNNLSYSWSIGGVTFRNVPSETVIAVHAILLGEAI